MKYKIKIDNKKTTTKNKKQVIETLRHKLAVMNEPKTIKIEKIRGWIKWHTL